MFPADEAHKGIFAFRVEPEEQRAYKEHIEGMGLIMRAEKETFKTNIKSHEGV